MSWIYFTPGEGNRPLNTDDIPTTLRKICNNLYNIQTIGITASWGEITGTLSNQTDLQNALNAKENSAWSIKTTTYTASSGDKIQADTSGGGWTLTLPASPNIGVQILIEDSALWWSSANLTIARNGTLINGAASNYTANVAGGKLSVVYCAGTIGWSIK